MNLVQLSYFEKVLEKGSYAAAAKAIPMSHQGLMKSMAALQKELGVPLFSAREGSSSLVPTEYATALADYAACVRSGHDRLEEEFARIARRGSAVRLGASTGVLGLLGIGFLGRFRDEHPEVAVVEEELPDLRCDEGLAEGTFDLALTVSPFCEAFKTVPLYEIDRYVWMRRNDELAGHDVIRAEDLAGRHVGVVGPKFKNYTGLLSLIEEYGVELASVDTSTELFWLSTYAHRPGHVAFTARHVLPLFERDSEIVARRFEGLPWGFGISWKRGRDLSVTEHAFVEHCRIFAHACAARSIEGFVG